MFLGDEFINDFLKIYCFEVCFFSTGKNVCKLNLGQKVCVQFEKGQFCSFCSSSVLCRVYPCILFRPQRKEKKKWTTSKPKARTWNPTCPASSTSSAASTRPPASPAPPRESPAPGRPGQTNPAPLLFPAFVPVLRLHHVLAVLRGRPAALHQDGEARRHLRARRQHLGHLAQLFRESPRRCRHHSRVSLPPLRPPCQFPFSRLSSAPPTSATSEPRSCGGLFVRGLDPSIHPCSGKAPPKASAKFFPSTRGQSIIFSFFRKRSRLLFRAISYFLGPHSGATPHFATVPSTQLLPLRGRPSSRASCPGRVSSSFSVLLVLISECVPLPPANPPADSCLCL